jgi:MATE family multidrug resistance protein
MDATSKAEAPAGPNAVADAWHDLREVMGLSFPVIIAMASHTMMMFVDMTMLAYYGRDELAAVGPSGAAAFAFLAFVMGTGSCVSTFVAQSVGRGQFRECARYTWQGMYFAVPAQALAIPLMILSPLIFAAFGHHAQVLRLEGVYFRIVLVHAAGTAAYASLASFFQGINRPGIPMVAAIVANVFNAVADYALIFGKLGCPRMGIAGAAWATTACSYFQVVLLLAAFLWRPIHEQFQTRSEWRLDLSRLRRYLAIGAPAGISFMLDTASRAIFLLYLIGPLGRDVLAANNVTNSILSLSFMPALGLNKGVTVLVGQYIGRGDIPAAKRRAYLSLGVAMAYMVFMGILFVTLRRPIMRWFSREPIVVEAGSTMLIFGACFQAFNALGIIAIGGLRGAGDTRFPAAVSILSGWCVMLPLGWVLTKAADLGYVGAWTAVSLHVATLGVIFFWRFVGEAWRKIDIFAGVAADGTSGD